MCKKLFVVINNVKKGMSEIVLVSLYSSVTKFFWLILGTILFFLSQDPIYLKIPVKTLRNNLQFPSRTSGAVIFIPYILLPSTYEVMLLICSRVLRFPAG